MHSSGSGLAAVKETWLMQPVDQGVRPNFKAYYLGRDLKLHYRFLVKLQ